MMMRVLLGTRVLLYPTQGRDMYIVSLDGCGLEENEVIKSLKKAMDMGELKII